MQYSVKQFITLVVVMLGIALLVIQAQDNQGGADAGKKRRKAGRQLSTCNSCRGMWTLKSWKCFVPR